MQQQTLFVLDHASHHGFAHGGLRTRTYAPLYMRLYDVSRVYRDDSKMTLSAHKMTFQHSQMTFPLLLSPFMQGLSF